ncbi:hypothetical protein NE237_028306 [Protea cynaroides]|uniref:Uncharacterized protein n=1 Tax=Protea cynaroides TaxID=273540 RepID=A0A9Q0GTJ1_9MAGN|nr:hypothetical protein NE237_028306 [Protea cynaroides]
MMLRVYAGNPMPRLSDGWVASAVRRWVRVGFSWSHARSSTGRMVSSSVVSTGWGEGDLPVREISTLPHLRFPKEKTAHQQGLGADLVEEALMSSVARNPMSTMDFGSSGKEWSSLSMMTALADGSDCAARCYQNPSVRTMDAYMESQTKNKAPGTSEIAAEASIESNRPLGEETSRGAGELSLNHALSQGTCDDTRMVALVRQFRFCRDRMTLGGGAGSVLTANPPKHMLSHVGSEASIVGSGGQNGNDIAAPVVEHRETP